MANSNDKKSAQVVKPTTQVKIDMQPSQFPWNNINKSAKNWKTTQEQAYQSFRFEIFNKNGDSFIHKHLFTMLLNTNAVQLNNEAFGRDKSDRQNRGFRLQDVKVLKEYASRITKPESKEIKDYSLLFSDSELLDMKIRMHEHSFRYWKRIGKPGYTPKRSAATITVATEADFKSNDLVNAFLSN